MEEGQFPKGKEIHFQGKGERMLNNRHCGHRQQRAKGEIQASATPSVIGGRGLVYGL